MASKWAGEDIVAVYAFPIRHLREAIIFTGGFILSSAYMQVHTVIMTGLLSPISPNTVNTASGTHIDGIHSEFRRLPGEG